MFKKLSLFHWQG